MTLHRKRIVWFVSAIAIAVLLYMARYGPANSLVRSWRLSARRVDAFYRIIPEKVRADVILALWTKIDTRVGVGER